MYQALCENPSIWFTELHEDDAHPNRFNKSSYGKPKLIGNMRKVLKTLDAFLTMLYAIGAEGQVADNSLILTDTDNLTKKYRDVMDYLGFSIKDTSLFYPMYPGMFPAWKWMTTRSGSSVLNFSRCMFDPNYAYPSDIFRRLSGNEDAFNQLEDYLVKNEYRRVDCRGGQVGLDYVKCTGTPGEALGHFCYDHNYIGICAEYEQVVGPPQCFALRIQQMRYILPLFNRMDDDLKEFLIKYNHRCDMCGYCVQRNKNTAKALNHYYITVEYHGETYKLCPLFPGYYYCWTALSDEIVNGLITFLTFMEHELINVNGR
jgi:hypothetical protein